MGVKQLRYTKDGHEMHCGINFLGHYLLTHYLWPKLNSAPFFRVINVSSIAHLRVQSFKKYVDFFDLDNINFEKRKYRHDEAYSLSKFYINLATHSIAEKTNSKGYVISLHPGFARTPLVFGALNLWQRVFSSLIWFFSKNSE